MKNVHILPTDQPSRLHLWTDENGMKLALCELEYSHTRNTQHLYITSSEDKEDNWYLDTFNNQVIKANECSDHKHYGDACRKIILTTNPTLIADGVQAIDDEFLEWLVQNPTCEFIETQKTQHVSYEINYNGRTTPLYKWVYKIIIPQEEPKQDCTCGVCNECEEQETIQILNEAKENALKQSTLEEAAKEFYPPTTTDLICSPKLVRDAFIAGANYQAERMYSDSIQFGTWLLSQDITSRGEGVYVDDKGNLLTVEDLFEQFKKK